ncbi:uncharacterized protein LOC127719991 isoform X2 [Mytilus californianus]|uniref:uncharacterized protein LOC127719991 isoform X2 n=1 Tax=Mytilus californianus TaxID=6549 RepID=UPI002247B898|nr:uncharacterized protein LOC127719991 isoform X2 [Mytilus californianus]
MKCTHESCGAEIPAGARFCTGCGTEVQTPVPVKTTLCPSCNNIVKEGYKFCYSCGGKIDPSLFIDRVCNGTKDDGQKCNTVLTSGNRFCPSCGTPQDTSKTQDTSNKDDLPGDSLVNVKLSLQITQGKEDNVDKTTPPVKEERGSSGSSSPETWEAPTITLVSNDKKTESVKDIVVIVQEDGSKINLAKTEPDVPSNTIEEQDIKTIETGQDCSSKIYNEGLELTDQQSNEPQGIGKAGPVDKERSELTDQVIVKPQVNELIGPDDKQSSGQTDQQTAEPKCSECSSPVDEEGPGIKDHESGGPQGNEHVGPVEKESLNLANEKAVEPEGRGLSGPVDKAGQGLTDQKSSGSQETNLTNMETKNTGPQSDHCDSNGNQNTEKLNSATEMDESKPGKSDEQREKEKEFTQIKTRDPDGMLNLSNLHRSGIKRSSGPDSAFVATKRRKDGENKEKEDEVILISDTEKVKGDQKETEDEVLLISDTESVEGGEDKNNENNERPSKRKTDEKGGQVKKIKGESDNYEKGKTTGEETKDKHGIQEEGDNKHSKEKSDQQPADRKSVNVTTETFTGKSDAEKYGIQESGSSVDPPQENSNIAAEVSESDKKEIASSEDKPGDNDNSKRITRSTTKAMKEKENKAGNKEQESEKTAPKNGTDARSVESHPNKGLGKATNSSSFDVFFHAIIHSSIYDDSCTAYIRFSLNRLGGWASRKHELFPVKKLSNGSYEVERLIHIPRDYLSTSIAYSYFVVSGNTDMMEYIYNTSDNIRYLYVKPDELKNTDGKLQKYDGVVRGLEVKEGMADFFWRYTGIEGKLYRKELYQDARLSIDVFLPEWQSAKGSASGCCGEAMIMQIRLVHQSLEKIYCNLMKAVWQKNLMQLFREALTKSLEPLWQEFIDKKEFCKEDKQKIILNAIAVAYLFREYDLTVSFDEGSALCQALLPEYEEDGKQYEIENLKEEMPQTFHLIPKVIVHFTGVLINYLDPSWLYCMPLVHFMYSQSLTGEKPNESVEHDSDKPVWWGIAYQDHYSFDLKKFKQKHIQEQYLQDIIEKLTPHFEMDYLLPRTLMSCIALEQLPLAAKSKWISPDIVLASICFYVRDEKHITKNDSKETALIECLTIVLRKLNEESLDK